MVIEIVLQHDPGTFCAPHNTINPEHPNPSHHTPRTPHFWEFFGAPFGENNFSKNVPPTKSVPYECGGAQNARDRFDPKEKRHIPNFAVGLFTTFLNNGASKAKQGQSNTMPIYSNAMDRTGQPGLSVAAPPVVSIILEYGAIVLECPRLALEAQLVHKSGE